MTTKFQQLSLSNIFTECQDSFINHSSSFFLQEHFNISEFHTS
ncbi:hypothetical protein AN2V17_13330 [Vallitalea sp. AN17-2]|uniref:Uncharacterized protein n=1 Tax=Vallitalea maricola TaxID=3074433 RepID=A0ACB5UGV8_9FIRM|nr:hypothetical protein AN2V17_13330 [Vallitalea sp. AN17-2]